MFRNVPQWLRKPVSRYITTEKIRDRFTTRTVAMGNAPANLSILRAIALNVLRRNGYTFITIAHRFISNDIDKLVFLMKRNSPGDGGNGKARGNTKDGKDERMFWVNFCKEIEFGCTEFLNITA